MPALLVLDLGESAPLDGAGEHDGRLSAGRVRGDGQGLVDLGEVVAVDGQHPCAERLGAAGVGPEVPLQFGGTTLAEPVDVHDRDQVGQPVVRGFVEGLPDGAFGHLAVPAQDPHPIGKPIEVFAGQRHPHPVGQSLAEGSGGDVDPRQDGGGMALQA